MTRIDELSRVYRVVAAAGAEVALSWHSRTSELGAREKAGPRDLVSQADLSTEEAVRTVLADLRPGDAVLGEEQGRTAGGDEVEWLVDPIDGPPATSTAGRTGRCRSPLGGRMVGSSPASWPSRRTGG